MNQRWRFLFVVILRRKSASAREINFVQQGGETALAGIGFIKKVIALLNNDI